MILECLLPEVRIWRLPNRKPLYWMHNVGVSPVRLRTHWAIKLVVGTLNLKKEEYCSIPFILSLLHTFALLLLLPLLIVSLFSSPIARYVAASSLATVISISGFHRLSVNYPLMPLTCVTSKICAKLLKSHFWWRRTRDMMLKFWPMSVDNSFSVSEPPSWIFGYTCTSGKYAIL